MFKFMIDAGHGGKDPGAGSAGLVEKVITLTVAKRIRDILMSEYEGIEVKLTRESDVYLTLSQRADLANAWKADFFLSVHVNAGGGAGGFESFIYPNITPESARVATEKARQIVHDAIIKEIGGIDRGKKKKDLAVVRETNMIAVLTEIAFIDVVNDQKRLRDADFLEKVARGHATGVAQAFNIKKKDQVPKNPILGESKASLAQMTQYVRKWFGAFDSAIAQAYLEVGKTYGVRGDVAFCQAIHETGWFKFVNGTAVTPDQHNYCGLGVTSKGVKGHSFRSIVEGVTAHIQHLYAYATASALPTGAVIIDPRFKYVKRGIAPNWEDLNGKWAVPGTTYGQSIIKLHQGLMSEVVIPPAPAKTYRIDLGTFKDKATADRLLNDLISKGFSAKLVEE